MNFEEHFLQDDIEVAKLSFDYLISNLKLINYYRGLRDKTGEEIAQSNLTNALANLNKLAIRKEESNQMYLHHLLNYPQKWYPV